MPAIRLGNALVDRVEEQTLPVSLRLLTDDDALLARRVSQLPDGFLGGESRTFQFSNHSWVVRVDGLTVLVDPCTGNGRKGRGHFFDDLDVLYLEYLASTGVTAETVDVVFCTHLHHDHCGWNTRQVDGAWVPTFPNASYLFVGQEYRRWDTANPDRHPNEYNPNVFDECVRPVVDAGLARIVSAPCEVSPSLRVEPAPGHTVGHAMLILASGGVRAYFSGGVFHHPVQLTRPDLHLPGCDDLATAVETRQRLVREPSTREPSCSRRTSRRRTTAVSPPTATRCTSYPAALRPMIRSRRPSMPRAPRSVGREPPERATPAEAVTIQPTRDTLPGPRRHSDHP